MASLLRAGKSNLQGQGDYRLDSTKWSFLSYLFTWDNNAESNMGSCKKALGNKK